MGSLATLPAITSSDTDCVASLNQAIDNFVDRKSHVIPLVADAIDKDPECAMAHTTLGFMIHGARDIRMKPKADASLEQAKQFLPGTSQHEKQYVNALELALNGQLTESVRLLENILDAHPTDKLALVLSQSELFWLGEMDWSARISGKCASHWQPDFNGYDAFLGVRSFDLEETGNYKEAEAHAREAVEINPQNIWATHALAHVMLMQNRAKDGAAWLNSLHSNWDDANQIQFHCWWHQCLFLIELGQQDQVLALYDDKVRNLQHPLLEQLPDLYIDVQNAASMLWRLEQLNVDVGDRWQELATLCTERTGDMSNSFTSAHMAIVLAAVEDWSGCDALLQHMASFVGETGHTLSKRVELAGIPACKAAIAHRQKDYASVIESLWPARQHLWQMGGSHAQRDIFFQHLYHALIQQGETDKLAVLLPELERIGFAEPIDRQLYAVRTIGVS